MNIELREQAQAQANLCRTFNNPYRVLILWVVGKRELSVGEIAEAIGSSLSNTSQHLQVMKNRGILASRRDGQTIYYRVIESTLLERCGLLEVRTA